MIGSYVLVALGSLAVILYIAGAVVARRVQREISAKPSRGDAGEAWLKHKRDQHEPNSEDWLSWDRVLDDYRLRSDYGLTSTDSTEGY